MAPEFLINWVMTLKEMPLIKATAKLGAHPQWVFANTFISGMIGSLMVAVFGATAAMFVAGFLTDDGRQLFLTLAQGVAWGLGLASLIFLAQAISYLKIEDRDEARARMSVIYGGFTGIALIVFSLILIWVFFEEQLSQIGPVVPKAG
ncbi:MAG: hypothetical protein MRY72_06665 [Aquisalinus sp.]|nr:hypothetical protein [Aquisalinus sp.]